jgi:hypothetical protein
MDFVRQYPEKDFMAEAAEAVGDVALDKPCGPGPGVAYLPQRSSSAHSASPMTKYTMTAAGASRPSALPLSRNSYRVKKPGRHGTRRDAPATIKLVNPILTRANAGVAA